MKMSQELSEKSQQAANFLVNVLNQAAKGLFRDQIPSDFYKKMTDKSDLMSIWDYAHGLEKYINTTPNRNTTAQRNKISQLADGLQKQISIDTRTRRATALYNRENLDII